MICRDDNTVDNVEFLRRFAAKADSSRIPLTGGIDLTYRCNLRCIHCYAGPCSGGRAAKKELSTAQVKEIISQAADAGCLFLLISGGEPLLREDFPVIYAHAKRAGLIVTVFTNATLVDDRIVELFERLPPHGVETTLYGASAATHDGITRVKGSFDSALGNVETLADRGFNVTLKTILMKQNSSEFQGMERLARELGVRFKMDAMIFPRLDGDLSPLGELVPAQAAVEKEFSSGHRVDSWRNYAARTKALPGTDRQYDCGAGVSSFHVDPYGNLLPCLMARGVKYDLTRGTFEAGWREVIPLIRKKAAAPSRPCGACDKRAFCSFCPGAFEMDASDTHFRYVCEVAGERRKRLLQTS